MTPFYFEEIFDNTAFLRGEEARHCIKVMRKKPGEDVVGIDGKGWMYHTRIRKVGKDLVDAEILARHKDWGEKPQKVVLLASPLHKPERFEWLVEKSVELGVTSIVPYVGKHTVKTGLRLDRLERIMIAALKQSMRSKLPEIDEPIPFTQAMKSLDADLKLVAHAGSGKALGSLTTDWSSVKSVILLVGPEGDFADEEIASAVAAGFKSITLGSNRLRSETAAMYLLGLAKLQLGY